MTRHTTVQEPMEPARSETHASTSENGARTGETNARTSENNARTNEINEQTFAAQRWVVIEHDTVSALPGDSPLLKK